MGSTHARALLVFHHIRSPRKKAAIAEYAKDQGLNGICKVGYPGVLAFEGEERPVRDYIRQIKVAHPLVWTCELSCNSQDTGSQMAASQPSEHAHRAVGGSLSNVLSNGQATRHIDGGENERRW